MDFLKLLIPATAACLCNALANMLWKFRFNIHPLKIGRISDVLSMILDIKIITGIMLYVISMLLFFYMLSNFKLSIIIPVTCLTYIFNIIISYQVFFFSCYSDAGGFRIKYRTTGNTCR